MSESAKQHQFTSLPVFASESTEIYAKMTRFGVDRLGLDQW
jgi:hypothetical protein